MRQRYNKFENTPYALEPNCKESPGGLRDLQVMLWVARAAGLGKSWDALARNGLATDFEVRQIKANEALLSLIRARLHIISRQTRRPAGVRPANGSGRILWLFGPDHSPELSNPKRSIPCRRRCRWTAPYHPESAARQNARPRAPAKR